MEIRRINNGKIFYFGNDVIPKYSFNAKELDEETGMYYFEARYYRAPTFTSRDPLFEKYFWMSPYAYCANNPVKYVDPTGGFPIPSWTWPSNGVRVFSAKGNIGAGLMYGLGATAQRGMALDKHGMTHFTSYSTSYIVNQNLYEGSSNPSFINGGGGSVGGEYSRDFSANSFIEAINNFSAVGAASAKFGIGGNVGVGENSFSIGAGIGLDLVISGGKGNIQIKESISLSKGESEKAGQFNQWSVCSSSILKQDKDGNSYFEGTVISKGLFGKSKNTGINVTSPAIKTDKGYAPSGIWMSQEYKNSLNAEQN